jgi:predicted tellurium resistance membrane protein TerC
MCLGIICGTLCTIRTAPANSPGALSGVPAEKKFCYLCRQSSTPEKSRAAPKESDMENAIVALVALIAMEIVLGIDNIVFIALLTSRLPEERQALGRNLGLGLALVSRLALLWLLVMMTDEKNTFFSGPLFTMHWLGDSVEMVTKQVSLRDLILLFGGLFLIGKSVHEMHDAMEGHHEIQLVRKKSSLASVLAQIALLDIVFSLDSVITAVGMADDLRVMVAAIVVAVIVMLLFAKRISSFIEKNPTLKMLALSFMILIGVMLVSGSLGVHISKGYIYFAMTFSILVEILNIRLRRKAPAIRDPEPDEPQEEIKAAAETVDGE